MPILDGSIVRVLNQPGDWRVVRTGLTLGTHLPTVYLEGVGHPADRLTELRSAVYPAPRITLN